MKIMKNLDFVRFIFQIAVNFAGFDIPTQVQLVSCLFHFAYTLLMFFLKKFTS